MNKQRYVDLKVTVCTVNKTNEKIAEEIMKSRADIYRVKIISKEDKNKEMGELEKRIETFLNLIDGEINLEEMGFIDEIKKLREAIAEAKQEFKIALETGLLHEVWKVYRRWFK